MWLAVLALPLVAALAPKAPGGKGPAKLRAPSAPGNPLTTGMPLRQQSISIPNNTIWMRQPGLNPNQWSFLDHEGKMMAYQYFLKMHNVNMLAHDVERYLEILSYVHEYLEWGPQGPPGGFSIKDSAMKIPLARPKRSVDDEQKRTQQKLEELLDKAGVADYIPKEKRSAILSVVSQTLTELKSLLPEVSLDQVAVDMKKMDENRNKRLASEEQPDFVTLFDSKAEKKYKKFLKREKKSVGEKRPYVEAVGTYVIVPKDTDLNWLQSEYRKTIKEQRRRRHTIDSLKMTADRVKASL